MENRGKLKAMFIIPSAIGVILFMIPVKNAAGEWTVTVKIIADIIAGAIGGFLPILSVAIVTISAVMTLVALAKPRGWTAAAVQVHRPDDPRRYGHRA